MNQKNSTSFLTRFCVAPFLFLGFTLCLCSSSLFTYGEPSLPDSLKIKRSNARNPREKFEVHLAIADHFMKSSYKESLAEAQQALYIAKQEKDPELLMRANKSVATVFYYKGILDQALHFMEAASKEATLAGNKIEALNNQLNISLLYSNLGQYEKAIRLLEAGKEQLMKVYKEAGKPIPVSDQITIFLNLGYFYSSINAPDKALSKIDSGIAVARKFPEQKTPLIKLLLTKTDALCKIDRLAESKKVLDEIDLISAKSTDRNLYATKKIIEARLFSKYNDYPTAIRKYREAFNDALAIENIEIRGSCIEGLYELYRQLGNKDSILHYLDLKEQFEKESTHDKTRQELIRKEMMTIFQSREQELIQQNSNISTRFWISLFVAGSLLIVATVILIRYRKQYRKANLKKLQLQLETERLQLQKKQLHAKLSQQEKQIEEYTYRLSRNAQLQDLVQGLQEQKAGDDPSISPEDSTQKDTSVWLQFENRFQQTHQGFYDRLLKTFPGLSPNERRLCAFLVLDMSSREISLITGQSIRAIEIARIRLRKKLNLTQSTTSLFEFLSNI